MNAKQWWAMPRGPERERAKAEYETAHPEKPKPPRSKCPGPGKRRGDHYVSYLGIEHPFSSKAEEAWARLISSTSYPPLDPARFVPELRGELVLIRDLRDGSQTPILRNAHPRIVAATIAFLLGASNGPQSETR
jgi:hypothetical protein